MDKLIFSNFTFRYKSVNQKTLIFDIIRKKFVVLTPEEWVRQHVVHFLIYDKFYPKSHINVEKLIRVNDLVKRYDVIVYYPNGKIAIVIECKASKVTISQQTFDQIARYNLVLNADYLMVTNGINHYYCQMDIENEKYIFLQQLPFFNNTES